MLSLAGFGARGGMAELEGHWGNEKGGEGTLRGRGGNEGGKEKVG